MLIIVAFYMSIPNALHEIWRKKTLMLCWLRPTMFEQYLPRGHVFIFSDELKKENH